MKDITETLLGTSNLHNSIDQTETPNKHGAFAFNPVDPEIKRRQALARVYALLIRLAENKEQAKQKRGKG